MWHTDATMEDSAAEAAEDNGLKKSAGPMWAYFGSLIGLVVTLAIFWYLETRR